MRGRQVGRVVAGVGIGSVTVWLSWAWLDPTLYTAGMPHGSLLEPAWFSCCEYSRRVVFPRYLAASIGVAVAVGAARRFLRLPAAELLAGLVLGVAFVVDLDFWQFSLSRREDQATLARIWLPWLVLPLLALLVPPRPTATAEPTLPRPPRHPDVAPRWWRQA